jgi:hypothetical protein
MSFKRTSSSGRFIERHGLLEDTRPEVTPEESRSQKVDSSPEEVRQLRLKRDETEADRGSSLEFNEDVDITPGLELTPDGGAEDRNAAHTIPPAQSFERFLINRKARRPIHEIIVAPGLPLEGLGRVA